MAQRRTVTAEAVLAGRVDLRMYPHQHLAVVSQRTAGMGLSEVMASADYLAQWGWELINVSNVGHNSTLICAVMRRIR
jgi:hypothetical protein